MEIETHDIPLQERDRYQTRLKSYRAELSKLENDLVCFKLKVFLFFLFILFVFFASCCFKTKLVSFLYGSVELWINLQVLCVIDHLSVITSDCGWCREEHVMRWVMKFTQEKNYLVGNMTFSRQKIRYPSQHGYQQLAAYCWTIMLYAKLM